ncbi:MAG: ABC transporter permease [Bacillota bacterium]|nr:ABC transporter permease [Bacillota bacterium]
MDKENKKEDKLIVEKNKREETTYQVDSEADSLSNVQRIKVLSPGMLVIKRFLRNRLAIIGFIIILLMFIFSFIGGIFSPYDETQVFKYIGTMSKEYASVTLNDQYRYTTSDEEIYDSSAHSKFILASNKGDMYFSDKGNAFYITLEGEKLCGISYLKPIAEVTYLRGILKIKPIEEIEMTNEVDALIKDAINQDKMKFMYNDEQYIIERDGRNYILEIAKNVAFESFLYVESATKDNNLTYDFKYLLEKTLKNNKVDFFEYNEERYEFDKEENMVSVYRITPDGREEYALVSQIAFKSSAQDVYLSVEFKKELTKAIMNKDTLFVFADEDGNNVEFNISRLNNMYTVKTETDTHLISIHEQPSFKHWLGTDQHGMDVLTRLMYGGKISLVIGFIVVFLEILIGVIMGGIAGYFGKWTDMIIMRIVDVFNCIPFLPLLIIIGSVMDSLDIDPKVRIYYLMLILGVMSWPGIARMVRGQILSLREQEFMLAAEATGLRISRRIFKHLIPNVIPQLIVLATLGLGGIIIYESTLSFLGLGVKFPYASWGNIISGVSTAYEMTNFWFVWIPAGMLILLTVLGFNFVGDGLRDAFDPKMKR